MKENICAGDIVLSVAGRDKGCYFLVVSVDNKQIKLIDGKIHKVNNPKIKNVKHVKLILIGEGKFFSDKINGNNPVGNEKLFRFIKDCIQKIGGTVQCQKTM